MTCNTCGRNIQNEESNFCFYCGSSLRENINFSNINNTIAQREAPTIASENLEKPISFLNWLASMGLMFIPVIGFLVYFVMLFVWAFSNTTPISKKNWAKVTLIVLAINFIFLIIYIINMMSNPIFMDILKSVDPSGAGYYNIK